MSNQQTIKESNGCMENRYKQLIQRLFAVNRQFFAFTLIITFFLNGFSASRIVNATISEREPNDERGQKLGKIRLNQMIEVIGNFRTTSDRLDQYSVNVLDHGSLTVRLQSASHLVAKVYRDNDGSSTFSPADFFVGTIQSRQSIKAHQSGEYLVQVFKSPNVNGFPGYSLLFVNQR
ncbi:hypothetical protein [Leptothermofonsia sp. ETS-13]|uniref:hypothetical protein n=1 Tax=Leptothermofonsia sp. ETS-13 TaxID=3035696 RepID=UPI003B9E86DD